MVSLAVAWADTESANAGRSFARGTVRKLVREGETVHFTGHLGFQHYAEAEGAVPLDLRRPAAKPGDLLVYPATNMQALVAGIFSERLSEKAYPSSTGLHTDNFEARAGFYSFLTGPLPYNVAAGLPIERFAADRVHAVEPRR